MKKLLNKLVFLLCLFITACASVDQPPAALTWQYVGSMSYEAQQPGLGASHRYKHDSGWIDVYIYNLQRSNWQAGVADAQFAAHFESTIQEIRMFAKRGLYTDLKIGEVRDVIVSGLTFRTVTFQYLRKGELLNSATYLTARNGKLLKYRVSIHAASTLNVDAVTRAFVEKNLQADPHGRPI